MPPQRTCVGCRAVADRGDLVRLVLADGVLVVDAAARRPGRGAWLHPERACCELAVRRGGFSRSLRTRVDASHLLDVEPWCSGGEPTSRRRPEAPKASRAE